MAKRMTCAQLGGACEEVFEAETFQEMAQLSQAHAKVKMQENDQAHLAKMKEMSALMSDPEAMQVWMKEKEVLFNSL